MTDPVVELAKATAKQHPDGLDAGADMFDFTEDSVMAAVDDAIEATLRKEMRKEKQ